MITSAPISTKSSVASFEVKYVATFLAPDGSVGATWAAMPAAETELFGVEANQILFPAIFSGNNFPALVSIDVGNTKMCVCVLSAGAAGATLKAQIFGDGAAWEDCSLPVPVDVIGVQVSQPFPGILNFPSDVSPGGFYFMRIVGNGGDGIASPTFGNISLAIGSQFISIGGG